MSGRRQWMRFNCYFCNIQMDGVSQTQVMKDGQEYFQTGYKCTQCGYKLVTYVTRAQALSIVDEICLPSALI